MILNLLAYIIIPFYTVSFVQGTNWFTMNFSVIGSWATRRNAFLLWGAIVGGYFFYMLQNILRLLPGKRRLNQIGAFLCNTAFLLLILAVATPYLPADTPFQAFLHVVFAFTASVLLLSCLYFIVWRLCALDRQAYRSYLTGLNIITAVCALLLVLAGIVSSALEIFFTISCTVLLKLLWRRITILNCP